jgi:hypothetical protein
MMIWRPLPCSELKMRKHLALRLAAAGEELDVVEQQQVDALIDAA